MAAALAALPNIMQLIGMGVPLVQHLITWVMGVRDMAKQSKEWTPELEQAFIDSLIATKTDPAYAPDPK